VDNYKFLNLNLKSYMCVFKSPKVFTAPSVFSSIPTAYTIDSQRIVLQNETKITPD